MSLMYETSHQSSASGKLNDSKNSNAVVFVAVAAAFKMQIYGFRVEFSHSLNVSLETFR